MKNIDARGLACPQPVLELKKALTANPGIEICILVDNEAAKENVRRFGHSQKCKVEIKSLPNQEFELSVVPDGFVAKEQSVHSSKIVNKTIYITDDKIGSDVELGKILLKGFIYALLEAEQWPDKIIFVNRGVFVTTQHAETIEDLQKLAAGGVSIYSCGTCLNYFNLTNDLKVGMTGNAYDTINSLITAENSIRL